MINRYERQGKKRSNYRLLARDAFPLMATRTCGVAPDGDGWATVVTTEQWNVGQRNPLNLVIRARVPRKQTSARMLVPIESRDDRQISLPMNDVGEVVDLGRNEAEVRPHTAQQGVRGVNWSAGSTYAGGQRAVREAMKRRQAYDALPSTGGYKESAEEIRQKKIAELEERIKQLMGMV